MAYINIPSIDYKNLLFNISYYTKDDLDNKLPNKIFLSNSLHHYILKIKQDIDKYILYWDNFKKITNPYEFIHTPVTNSKFSVCKYKPLSRSFFKMIEMINTFHFLNDTSEINTFHLAEGPGGFLEAFNFIRENSNDKYYGITLISNDINIPSWKKSNFYLNNNKRIIIENGSSKDGNLFLEENFNYCYKKYYNSMDYITADGGFDFSIDFNKQEDLSIKLIIIQILYALVMQKKNGNFILKIFDVFKLKTIEIIFLLTNFYENIYIYKPFTSRIANSEKYIVCKNFKSISKLQLTNILENFSIIVNNIDNIKSLLNVEFPRIFINKLEEINAIYGQQQIENINNTLNLIRENINIETYRKKLSLDGRINNHNTNDNTSDNTNDNTNDNTSDNNNIVLSLSNHKIKKYKNTNNNDNDNNNDNNNDNINNKINDNINDKINDNINDNISLTTTLSTSPQPIIPQPRRPPPARPPPTNPLSTSPLSTSPLSTSPLSISPLSTSPIFTTCISSNINYIYLPVQHNNSKEDISLSIVNNICINKYKEKCDKFNNKLATLKTINIQKSIGWCNKYGFVINKQLLDNM